MYDETSEYRFIRSGLLVIFRGAAASICRMPVNRMLVLTLQLAWLNSIPGNHPQSDSDICKTCPKADAVSLKRTLSFDYRFSTTPLCGIPQVLMRPTALIAAG